MMMASRLKQLERRFLPKSWTDELSDDQWETAIAVVTGSIARRADISVEALADMLEYKVAGGDITDQGDRKLAEQYIGHVRSATLTDCGTSEISTLFRAAALCLRLDRLANPDNYVMTDDPFTDLMQHISAHGQRSIVKRADAR